MKEITRLFPDHFQHLLKRGVDWKTVQEIRVRVNRGLEIQDVNGFQLLEDKRVSSLDLSYILNQISQFSLYRFKDELKEGFITVEGGHRIGFAGKANTIHDEVDTLKHISYMNIRIARASNGESKRLLPYLYKNRKWLSTMIIGPPHSGKTTLLRDLAKVIGSEGGTHHASKVGVVDERSEIAASLKGVPQLDVGTRTDVMDGCPKAEGMMMMIRSMSPEVLIVDEIGGIKDAVAIREAAHTGVEVICSIHGTDLFTLKKRPSAKEIIEEGIFERYILLERLRSGGAGHTEILDSHGHVLAKFNGRPFHGMDRGIHNLNRNHLGGF